MGLNTGVLRLLGAAELLDLPRVLRTPIVRQGLGARRDVDQAIEDRGESP